MILVTGGSGNVGSRVVQTLLDTQQPVRVYSRGGSDWHTNPLPGFRRAGADVVTGDLHDRDKLAMAVDGCKGIIHLAAAMRGTPADMDAVNVDGLQNIVDVALQAGIQRFIHVSCLGATEFNSSHYFSSKWHGEMIVRAAPFYWTIFRPSLIFGPFSHMMMALDFCVAKMPIVPVFGSGLNHIAPVSPDDVAACVLKSLYDRNTVNQTYDLAGPETYDLTELLEYLSRRSEVKGRRRPTVKIPLGMAFLAAQLVEKLKPRSPISEDLLKVLTSELAGDPDTMRTAFQVEPVSFQSQFKRISKR